MAKILIIEDDHGIRYSLRLTLETMGHEVDVAVDGMDGCEKCGGSQYDLVITDIIMPNRDGAQTIAFIKDDNPAMKIVAMSGGGSQNDERPHRKDLGADYMLEKPFSIVELKTCLETML